MTNMNIVSSEERDDDVATSLPEDGDGVEEDILEQEIPSFIAFVKCTIEINGETSWCVTNNVAGIGDL